MKIVASEQTWFSNMPHCTFNQISKCVTWEKEVVFMSVCEAVTVPQPAEHCEVTGLVQHSHNNSNHTWWEVIYGTNIDIYKDSNSWLELFTLVYSLISSSKAILYWDVFYISLKYKYLRVLQLYWWTCCGHAVCENNVVWIKDTDEIEM